ncbi:MAG: 1-acyl-sn-glycerol-3-phosphate acyltransferase [Oscillospiraceae bacterium]|nr:1-acyl-sn-glycerol-3-phosphate acyltransferase [Oscillospiraceae bacterium]
MAQNFKWKASYRFYKGGYYVVRVIFSIFFRIHINGREHIPSGAAMVCANHSSVLDPIFVAFAAGSEHFLHFIAKVEIFKTPVLSFIVMKLGAISVDREMRDITTIKQSLSYFKNGEKVAIFPEGSRADKADEITAKTGAVKIAERAGVPIVPIYVPRRKHVFSRVNLVIGVPYHIEKSESKRTPEAYLQLSEQLMTTIEKLGAQEIG